MTYRNIVGVAGMLGLMMSLPSSGHDVITTRITFSREISRMIDARCASCHRPGGRAFSLLTYEDARPWAKAIKEEVLERRMPPWGAVKGFGEFRDDQSLSQEQIGIIAEWVEGGAPEGDPALLPRSRNAMAKGEAATLASEIPVEGRLVLKAPLTLSGIRPKSISAGTSLMVIATHPGGRVEPLLWLYKYEPRFARTYRYSAALRFAAGTTIEVTPANGGTIALIRK